MKPSDDSTASDPLLPPTTTTTFSDTDADDPPISYNHSHSRPVRDLPFLLLFLLLSLSSFALGFVAIARRNPNYSVAAASYHFNSTSCTLSTTTTNDRLSSSLSSHFTKDLIFTLIATAAFSVPIAFLLLFLLRRFARQLVYVALPFFILLPSFLNLYWFLACAFSSSCSHDFPLPYRIMVLIFVFLIIGLFLWIIIANWHRIELTIRIVGISAAALEDNLALFGVLPAMGVGVLVYFVPFVVFLVFAKWNGRVVPKMSDDGELREYVCVWKEDKWVPAYFALAIITMIWTAATMVEAQVYVISGTIAQWYFAKEEGTKPRKSIRTSLR